MAKWADILQDVVEVTAPSAEPITTTEAKQFLRVDHATQDDLIDDLIAAARQRVEADTGRSLITTTWDLSFDAFPDERAIVLPRLPLASVTSVTSYDADDTAATLSSSDYLVDTAQGRPTCAPITAASCGLSRATGQAARTCRSRSGSPSTSS